MCLQLNSGSNFQINISYSTYAKLHKVYLDLTDDESDVMNISKDELHLVFNSAINEILDLLKDSHSRFIKTTDYEKFKEYYNNNV